jgi:hypothetical protein
MSQEARRTGHQCQKKAGHHDEMMDAVSLCITQFPGSNEEVEDPLVDPAGHHRLGNRRRGHDPGQTAKFCRAFGARHQSRG